MNYIDYIIIFFLLVGFLLGFKDGLVRKIIGLIGLILAITLAFELSEPLGKFITPVFNNENYLAELVSGIFIFVLTIFAFSVLKRIVHPLDKVNKFINQLLGGISGTLQMLFFVSAFLLLLNIFNIPAQESKNSSVLYKPVQRLIPNTIDFFLGTNTKVKYFIQDFIESKDSISIPINLDSLSIPLDADSLSTD